MRITQGTFSFLDDLTDAEIETQIGYALENGWAIMVEYTDDPHPRNAFWDMWNQPEFDLAPDEADVAMRDVHACREAYPNHYVKVVCYDSSLGRQTSRLSFIVNRPEEEPGIPPRAPGEGRPPDPLHRGPVCPRAPGRASLRQPGQSRQHSRPRGGAERNAGPRLAARPQWRIARWHRRSIDRRRNRRVIVSARGLDTTGRPLDPQAERDGRRGASRGNDHGSPSFSDEFGGEVVRPEKGATAGSAVASVDFSEAVSGGEADIGSVIRDSRVHEVLEELDRDLVALEPVKRRIREVSALLVINRLREEMGLTSERPTLHMSFTGNPGTGKTTVALRMAAILHRLGYVDKGHLVAVTRDDLVGQYVGHTAPKTKDIVKRAIGGILFIDEAYYLHRPENERDYGQEAIEVLLQVMESERQQPGRDHGRLQGADGAVLPGQPGHGLTCRPPHPLSRLRRRRSASDRAADGRRAGL